MRLNKHLAGGSLLGISGTTLLVAMIVASCQFKPGPPGSALTSGSGNPVPSQPGTNTPGNPFGAQNGNNGGAGAPAPLGPCTNLECSQSTCRLGACAVPACAGGAHTTVSGKIYDPAGKVPLFNVAVYVPNAALAPIKEGPSCDPCDKKTGTSLLSGSPIAIARTDETGSFKLGAGDRDVPAGDNIPLVIQVGKWQRQITIPKVTACMDTAMADPTMMRLPKNQSEGHIPRMALTTGEKDAMECLLRKIGLDDTEFTPETGTGRVNFYGGGGGTAAYATTLNGGAAFTPAQGWWDSLDNLKKYDIILHSCEGGFGSYNGNNPPMSTKSPAAIKALNDFADLGGRVFASHWHAYWFENGTPAFQSIATFNHRAGIPNPYDATIDQSFPTGMSLAKWMINVGGSTMPGVVTIAQDASNRLVDAVAGGNISQRWIYAATLNPPSVQYMSATTPIPGGTCGRVVLSDIHVSAGAAAGSDIPAMPFPSGCVTTTLSPQEKVIEFMLFDISNCVTPIIP
jgi:hypothetical protein